MSIYLWFLDFATVYSYFNIQLCSFFIVENNCFFKKWVFLFIGRGYISRGELSAPKFLGVCFAHNGRGEEGGGSDRFRFFLGGKGEGVRSLFQERGADVLEDIMGKGFKSVEQMIGYLDILHIITPIDIQQHNDDNICVKAFSIWKILFCDKILGKFQTNKSNQGVCIGTTDLLLI